ncbi:hypothetical protein G6F62_001692 [Rhizopus arrhizus]|nr:hypothetical protein G6F62_001692 [Rhizopus arrhizus]
MLRTNRSASSSSNLAYSSDGLGNQYDNKGNEIMDIQMEVDNEMYPIENVTNSNICIDLKPSEKELIRL